MNGEFMSLILHILPLIYQSGSGSIVGIRIRIHEGPKYGSKLDPDPQHCYWL